VGDKEKHLDAGGGVSETRVGSAEASRYRRLNRVAAAFVMLCVLLLVSPAPARGQGVGIYRGRQGRRVGRVTLPTPPFNPDAGILGSRKGRVDASPKAAPRRPKRRGVKTAKRKTARKMSRKRV
jgi:hypothetical protein